MLARDLFWFAAGLMAALAGIFVALPLLRARSDETPSSPRQRLGLAAAAVGGIAIALVALYAWLGTPSALEAPDTAAVGTPQAPVMAAVPPAAGGTASSMEDAITRLSARLSAGGGTPDDWRLLAQSYEFLGRNEQAAAARKQADAAAQSATSAPTAVSVPADRPAAVVAPAIGAAAPGAAGIEGLVELGPALRSRDTSGATLYIYARQIGAGGPPLAVLRVAAGKWPVRFVLDDSHAMVPGRNLSSVDKVLLEARVSRSGNATPQSGDMVGTINEVNPRAGQPVRIAIDREIG